MKKAVSLLLVLLLLAPAFSACGKKSTEPTPDGSAVSRQPTLSDQKTESKTSQTTAKKPLSDTTPPKGDDTVLKDPIFELSVNKKSGGLDSIVVKNDSTHMNWVGNTRHFGEIYVSAGKNKTFANALTLKSVTQSKTVYENESIRVTVLRSFDRNGCLDEHYIIKNIASSDLFFRKGDIGIYVPLADE